MAKKTPIVNKKHIAHAEVVRRQDLAIRITTIVIIVAVIGVVSYGVLTNTVLLPYRTVATVNGDRITAGDFQARVRLQRVSLINQFEQYYQFAQFFGSQNPLQDPNFGQNLQQIQSQLNPSAATQLGQQTLDQMVNEQLVMQEAKKEGVTLSPADIDKGVQEAFGYYANGSPTPTVSPTAPTLPTLNPTELSLVTITPTPTNFLSPTPPATSTPNLTETDTPTPAPSATATATTGPTPTITGTPTATATATPYTLEGFQTTYSNTIDGLNKEIGITADQYRQTLTGQIYMDKMKEKITANLSPIQDEVWARQILVATEDEANQVEQRLKNGEDWAKVAADVSIDPSTKDNGGDLGWFAHGAMVKEFETAAFALKVGEISQPVQSQSGWYVIQVLGHEKRPLTATEFQQFKTNYFNNWVQNLHDKAQINTDTTFWQSIVPAEPTLPATTSGQ